MNNIAIFASGNGTNAENLINYFDNHPNISIKMILSNNSDAYVLERAKKHRIPYEIFNREQLRSESGVLKKLIGAEITAIVLAGFLWLVPEIIIKSFVNKIINIHPALLPKYGGKGMYGHYVHHAVIKNKELQSGITIHLVDEVYDNGKILFQETCDVSKEDSPESLAQKIHDLEYEHFPTVVECYLLSS